MESVRRGRDGERWRDIDVDREIQIGRKEEMVRQR